MATAAADDTRQWLNHHENEAVCLNAATSYVNRFGETGLHDIIHVPELSIEVVLTWLKLAPKTARVKSDADWLPLHGACYEAPLNTVMALVEAYPNGLKEKTANGELPFHCVLHQRQRPLKLDVLNFLLEAYPESIHDADNLELATYFLNRWI
jgi:ankyrin repeat protein